MSALLVGSGKSTTVTIAGEYFDLLFLDIEMEGLSGIELGEMIRNDLHNDTIHIVYISSYKNYAMSLFKIRPLDFLEKPVNKEKIMIRINEAVRLLDKGDNYYPIKLSGSDIIIRTPINDRKNMTASFPSVMSSL